MEKAPKNRPQAIVLGMTPNGLGVIRSLGRQKVPVLAIGSHKSPSMFSRYCRSVISPDVETEEGRFLEFIIRIGKGLDQPGILFPTGDAYVTFVSENRDVLSHYFKFAMPDKETMRQLLNKKPQYAFAKKLGIPLPKTFYPRNLDELREISEMIDYPAVIKALCSISWRRSFPVKKVIFASSPEELLKAYQVIDNLNIETMIQEVIQGGDDKHYKICAYMNKKSEPLLIFTLKKLRNYPCHFGVGSVVESCKLPEVSNLGLRFLQGVGYFGIGSIEFKQDERDNQLKMIELNSRLWLQNSLTERCGMNFPYTMYLDLIGEKVDKQSTFIEGIKWISMRLDYASFRGYHGEHQLSYLEWWKSLRGRKIFEIFDWDDPAPFFYSTGFGLKIMQKFLKKITKFFKYKNAKN